MGLNEYIAVKLRDERQHVTVNARGRVDNRRPIRATARKKSRSVNQMVDDDDKGVEDIQSNGPHG